MTTFYLNGLLFLQDYYIFFKLMLTDIFCVCVPTCCLYVECMCISLCVLVCTCVFAASAESAAVPPACNKSEQSYLFNSCLLPFGVAHLKFLPVMRASQTCLRQNIQCQYVPRYPPCTRPATLPKYPY